MVASLMLLLGASWMRLLGCEDARCGSTCLEGESQLSRWMIGPMWRTPLGKSAEKLERHWNNESLVIRVVPQKNPAFAGFS